MVREPVQQGTGQPFAAQDLGRTRRRRDGQPCCAPAMRNGRCHKHGGASTGWRSTEGIARLRQAPLKHGGRSAKARQAARDRSEARKVLAALNDLLRSQ